MPSTGGRIKYSAHLDDKELQQAANRINSKFGSIGEKAQVEGAKIDNTFKRIGAGMIAYFGGTQLLSFAKQVTAVRGEFQQLDIALESMIGNKAKSDKLMADVVQMAAKTPFKVGELGQATKQLIAAQEPTEEIMDSLRRLGDLSAGLSVPISQLIKAYGDVRAKGRLMGMEMLQFMNAGVPMVKELAEHFGVAESEVSKMVAAGTVGFDDVKAVISRLADEGGMFYNLMEKQSASLTGQISILGDAWTQMMNDIGQANEGTIGNVVTTARQVVEHYEEIWKVLKVIIATYGTYRAVLVSFAAIQKASMAAGTVKTWFELARGIRSAKDAQLAFNLVSKANPWVLIASVIAGAVTALMVFRKEAKSTEDIISGLATTSNEFSESTKGIDKMVDDYERLKDKTERTAGETEELERVISSLASTVPQATDSFSEYGDILDINIEKVKEYSKGIKEALEGTLETKITEGEKEIDRLSRAIEYQQKIFQIGEERRTKSQTMSGGVSLSTDYTYKFDDKEKEAARLETLKLNKDRTELLAEIANARAVLSGLKPPTADDAGGKTDSFISNINAEIEATIKEIDRLKKEVSGLRSGDVESQDYAKDIEENVKALGDAQKRLEVLTGEKEEKISGDLEKLKAALSEQSAAMQLEIDQARINAMDEGIDKILAQNELNLKKELIQIEKHKAERAENLKEAGVEGDDASYYEAMEKAASDSYLKSNKAALEAEENKNKELLAQYESLLRKRERLQKEYAQKETTVAAAGGDEEHLEELARERDERLEEIDLQIAEREAAFVVWSEQIANMGLSELKKALETAAVTMETTGSKLSDKEKAVLRAQIKALQKRLEVAEARAKAKESSGSDVKSWEETLHIMHDVQATVSNMISSFDGMNDATKTVLTSAMNIATGTISMIMAIQTLGVAAGETIKGVEKASVILAIIGAALQVMTAIFSMFDHSKANKEHEEAINKIMERRIAHQREFNKLLLEQKLLMKEAESIFGVEQILKAKNAMDVYRESIELYRAELQGGDLRDKTWIEKHFERMIGQEAFSYTASREAYEKGVGALHEAKVVTGSKKVSSGLFGLGKKQKDVYSSMLSVYPDLLDAENRLNIERAKTIVSTEKMSDADKDLVQSLIDLEEQAQKAEEALTDYLADTFGALGSGIMDSISNAIASGTDAWEDFGSVGAEILEDLGKQIAYSLYFADSFKSLEDNLKKVYDKEGKTQAQIAEESGALIEDFYNGIGAKMEGAQKFLEGWDEKFESFDLWSDDSRSGAQKGFGAMTQDAADELNGRFTAIQGHTYMISENMRLLIANSDASLTYLSGIEQNTQRLFRIESSLEDMNTKGLKLRT